LTVSRKERKKNLAETKSSRNNYFVNGEANKKEIDKKNVEKKKEYYSSSFDDEAKREEFLNQ
jgi:hypothetical protein